MKSVELLAPAGNPEKLKIAVHYGADAVYLAGKDFNLRNLADNFTDQELAEAIGYAHDHDVKVYVACNIFPRDVEEKALKGFLTALKPMAPDGIIIADPGVVLYAREIIPEIPIHLSTQANTTHSGAFRFWEKFGVRRINVARELSLKDIRTISDSTSIQIEAFVHGAMCIAYSGRCLLSSFMAGRPGNLGRCCHPCRWEYSFSEPNRPGQYFGLSEDNRGSFIFNSKDLCMIKHIPEMIQAGIRSLKIEGRMKGIHYLATTVKAYREALDDYFADPASYTLRPYWLEELSRVTQRGYCTGFYLSDPSQTIPEYTGPHLCENRRFCGKVLKIAEGKQIRVDIRNRIAEGDSVEVLKKEGPPLVDTVKDLTDYRGVPILVAQPGSHAKMTLSTICRPNDLLRLRIKNSQ